MQEAVDVRRVRGITSESTPLLVSSQVSWRSAVSFHETIGREKQAQTEETILCEANATSKAAKFRLRIGYACGHAQNDLCGAMYFSYLLVYLEGVGLSPLGAGAVLIAGQFVDGIATPLVGSLSDRYSCVEPGCCYGISGRRKSWYIGGLILVSSTFWVLFTPYPAEFEIFLPAAVYYGLANCVFQIGWATVQVSNMAMVPELTPLLSERIVLNSLRFAVTVCTSIIIYVLVWLFLANDGKDIGASGDTEPETGGAQQLQEEGALHSSLQVISYIVLLAGAILGLVFILLVREGSGEDTTLADTQEVRNFSDAKAEPKEETPPKTMWGWFLTDGFWGVTANYSFTRLCVNAIQLYLPFFVLYSMSVSSGAVATVPLTAYIGMCVSSALAPWASALVTDAAWLYAAGVTCLSAGSTALFLAPAGSSGWAFLASGLLGVGCAQLMVASQTQVCELVGCNSNGGTVFGINSFCDKVSTGVIIFVIQRFAQGTDEARLGHLYRLTTAGVPLVCAVLGGLSLLTVPMRIRDRQGCKESNSSQRRGLGRKCP